MQSRIAKPHKEIERQVRKTVQNAVDQFPKDVKFEGFSDALYERQQELVYELTSFYLDVQEEARNPKEAKSIA